MPEISIMAALGDNYAIGYQGKLPWHLPADLERVQQIAQNQTFIMGRQTFLSPDAIISTTRNLVLSNSICELKHPNSFLFHSMGEALDTLTPDEKVLIMGGVQVYQEALAFADNMYLTFVHDHFKADAFFPKWNSNDWEVVKREQFEADEHNPYPYSFVDFRRQ